MSAPSIQGLRSYLLADATLAALVSTRIFNFELPASETASMPRQCVVLSLAGGPGSADYIRIGRIRIDVWNYGESPAKAWDVRQASHDALKHIRQDEKTISGGSGVMLHNAIEASGPRNFKDPEGNYPVILETWIVTASEAVTT